MRIEKGKINDTKLQPCSFQQLEMPGVICTVSSDTITAVIITAITYPDDLVRADIQLPWQYLVPL
jgi:hypothetical protein